MAAINLRRELFRSSFYFYFEQNSGTVSWLVKDSWRDKIEIVLMSTISYQKKLYNAKRLFLSFLYHVVRIFFNPAEKDE